MESNSNDFNNNLRDALARYESRFSMPDNLISDTMAEISRRKERRDYMRGLVVVSAAVLLLIALTATLLHYLHASILPSDILLGSKVCEAFSVAGRVFSSPVVAMISVMSAVLVSLDYFMRSRLARHTDNPIP
ncbi:MAG: hypothetical protein K2M12_05060 [Muribaculaceae bacterium]|nr:hypothetical protein [Muribaculaceae bacterium]